MNVQQADALGVCLAQKTGDWRDGAGRTPQYYWVTAKLKVACQLPHQRVLRCRRG